MQDFALEVNPFCFNRVKEFTFVLLDGFAPELFGAGIT
jgi:hypothetical protein